MCNQRSAEWTRSLSGRWRRGDAGSSTTRRGLLAAAVFNASSRDLFVARKVGRDGRCAEGELLLHKLIRAVLARRFDEHAIRALIHDSAPAVAAVPRRAVLARETCRTGNRGDKVLRLRIAAGVEPLPQLADVSRPTTGRIPPEQ